MKATFQGYFLALQPRRIVWFVLPPLAAIPAAVHWLLPNTQPSTAAVKAIIMAAIYLAVLLVVLLFSGYVAWGKEREKNYDLWPRIGPAQRAEIIKNIGRINPAPALSIYAKDVDDCVNLAVDLCEVIAGATNGRAIMVPNTQSAVPSGIVITARPEDQRGPAIQSALKKAGIEAHLTGSRDGAFRILIGPRT